MAYCGNCGAYVPEGMRFCPSCGFAVGQAGSMQMREVTAAADKGETVVSSWQGPAPQPQVQPAQQMHQVPMSAHAAQPAPQPTARQPKRKSCLGRIVKLAAVLFAACTVLFYVLPEFFDIDIELPFDLPFELPWVEKDEPMPPDVIDDSWEDIGNTGNTGNTGDTGNTGVTPIIPDGDPEQPSTPSTPSTPSQPSQPATPSTPTQTDQPTKPAEKDYSTTDTPVIQEFDWFEPYTEAPIPDGAVMVTSFSSAMGGWKAYIIYEPVVEGAHSIEELLNVYVGGQENYTEVTFDWFWARDAVTGNAWKNETENTVLTGSWSNGMITASSKGVGTVYITSLWIYGDHQYAIGHVSWSDGTEGSIALNR